MTEVVAALIWRGDKFMICQRPVHKASALLWEFVGGKVESGETKEQALVRECREELAVTVCVGEVFAEAVHEYPDITVHLTLFNASIAEGEPQKLEHNDIRWITPAEIPSYEFSPANVEMLQKIQKAQNKCKVEYSPAEQELNERLFDECSKEDVDFTAVEALLKQGADPIGVYDSVLAVKMHERENIPQLTKLFLEYGMDIDDPRIPYDGGVSINPLWTLGVGLDEYSIATLKLLLDHGISVASFGEFWSAAIGDLLDSECGDPMRDERWNRVCTLSLKATMLAASYDYILNGCDELRSFIGCSYNDYSVHNFRNWNDFTYEFDTTHCTRHTGYLYRAVVTIYHRESQKQVWKFGACLDGSDIKRNEDGASSV